MKNKNLNIILDEKWFNFHVQQKDIFCLVTSGAKYLSGKKLLCMLRENLELVKTTLPSKRLKKNILNMGSFYMKFLGVIPLFCFVSLLYFLNSLVYCHSLTESHLSVSSFTRTALFDSELSHTNSHLWRNKNFM